MPLANDPILSGRLIRSFRHLECQNPSIISDFIRIYCWMQENARNAGGGGILFYIEEFNILQIIPNKIG